MTGRSSIEHVTSEKPHQDENKARDLIVGTHGIGREGNRFWGSTIRAMRTHVGSKGCDIRFWGYESSKQPETFIERLQRVFSDGTSLQSLEQLGEQHWSDLRHWFNEKEYERVKLISYSFGGLITAAGVGYGVWRNEKRDQELIEAISSIAFVATPLGGSRFASKANAIVSLFGNNIQLSDLTEGSRSRKAAVTTFIHAVLQNMNIPLKIYRASGDSIVDQSELVWPILNLDYEEDVLAGSHTSCVRDLQAGDSNLEKIMTWICE